jgi:CheY-like chemotaxis protein
MFAQVNSTLHRAQGGLGIGLALARSIVELHGGSIRAHSEGLGSGSVFSLQLPAVAQGPTGAEAAAGDTGAAAAAPAPLRVLVVDDNRDAADSLAMLLQQMGHLARSVHGGQEALELVKGWTPDLAFIDIGMPKVSGFDLVRSLRQQGLQALLVALTGWGTQADTDRSRDAGFDLHLTKPLAPQALQEALQRALQARAVPGSAR